MRMILLLLLTSGVVAAQTPPPSTPPPVNPPAGPPSTTLPPITSLPRLDPSSSAPGGIPSSPRMDTVPPPGSVDEAVANAMKQHPDVKLAEAKRLVAEAEWEQTRLLVTQRITNAFAKVEQAKARLKLAEVQHNRLMDLHKSGALPQTELAKTESELLSAKSDLAIAEADLLVAKGAPARNTLAASIALAVEPRASNVPLTTTVPTPATKPAVPPFSPPSRTASGLKEFIEKKVSLKLEKPRITVAEAFEALKVGSGRKDLIVRLPPESKLPTLDNLVGEQTVLGWIELIMDEIARPADADEAGPAPLPGGSPFNRATRRRDGYQIYVRDYGLLMTLTSSAPQDAFTLAEFARMNQSQTPAVKP